MAIRNIYSHLKKLGAIEKKFLYRLEPDCIVIATKERVIAILSMEKDLLELSFDHDCPFDAKVSLVNVIKKAAPQEKLIIGPDVALVQITLSVDHV